jgi:hypothetical protein
MMLTRALLLVGGLGLGAIAAAPAVARAASGEALRIARESQPRWRIGAITLRDRHGRARVRADLVADGIVIAHLRLDPTSGALVADARDAEGLTVVDVPRLQAAAVRALSRLEIAGWAWPAAHGRAWRIPLRCDGRVVATVTVDVARGRLLGEREHQHGEGDES